MYKLRIKKSLRAAQLNQTCDLLFLLYFPISPRTTQTHSLDSQGRTQCKSNMAEWVGGWVGVGVGVLQGDNQKHSIKP